MSQALEKYLDRIMIFANRNETDASGIREELKDHLLKKIADLELTGMSREDAIFQAIEDHGSPKTIGDGLRPRFAWVDVRTHGTARGFVAVGPKAIGVIAIGGFAMGLITFSGIGLGLLSFGGLAIGMFMSFAGIAIAPMGIAYGGITLGLISLGGIAIGAVANGGLSIGVLAQGNGFSHFSPETAPVWLNNIMKLTANNKHFYTSFLSIAWSSYAVLSCVCFWLNKKESNRIKNADPTLLQ